MNRGKIPNYDFQDLVYSEPFIGGKGHPVPAQLFYRQNKLFIDFIQGVQKLFLPFTGKEKKCLDCGRNRELVLELDLNGKYLGQHEVCDNK